MPKITILEKDLTTAGASELLSNIVYVPGYAITGPENTPTLCRTLDEFKETFGSVPYKFKSNQYINTGSDIYAYADDYEKSYTYALELVNRGLPILFERYVKNIDYVASATLTSTSDTKNGLVIKAIYSGIEGASYGYKVTGATDNQYSFIFTKNGITINPTKPVIISLDDTKSNYFKRVSTDYIIFTSIGTLTKETKLDITTNTGKLEMPSDLTDEFTVSDFYTKMKGGSDSNIVVESIFDKLADNKDLYNIKIITSGSYPTFTKVKGFTTEIADKMIQSAASLNDVTAIIDHSDDCDVNYLLENISNLTDNTDASGDDVKKYAAMFTPWGTYTTNVATSYLTSNLINMPASFAYISALANSIKSNPNWYAVAGVTRGVVPGLKSLQTIITGAQSEKLQETTGISINPIMNVPSYGYCIWGNRTLHENDGLVASSFLNIRTLVNDIKKVVYQTSKELTFELNNDVTWLKFKSKIEPTLDKMATGNGINGYKIIRAKTDKKATIKAIIRIYPIEAVEDFDITIELADSFTTAK